MPRGRPPNYRTKEEAVNARRDQVRRNVQAFRERKRLQKHQEIPTSQVKGPSALQVCDQNLWEDELPESCVAGESDHVNDNGSVEEVANSLHNSIVASQAVNRTLSLRTKLPPEINRSPVSRQQFVANCVTAFKPASRSKTGLHWAQVLPKVVNRDRALDLAIQAVCLMQIGSMKNDRWLLEEGGSNYGHALSTLYRRLPTNNEFREEVFMAMMTLAIYELFQGTNSNGDGWVIHYRAAYRYLENLSEANHGWLPNNQIYYHFLETLCVFDAIGSRRPCRFSDSDAWSRSLERWGGETYGPLIGLMTPIPALLEKHDYLMKPGITSPESFSSSSDLLEQCLWLQDRFYDWYQDASRDVSGFTYTTSETFTGDIRVTFPTLLVARLHLLYWCSLISLLETAINLLSAINPDSPSNTPDLLNTSQTKCHEYALLTRQSAPFCLDPDNGVVGKTLLLLPIWIARNYFERLPNVVEAERCNDILTVLGQRYLEFGLTIPRGRKEDDWVGLSWRKKVLASTAGRKQWVSM